MITLYKPVPIETAGQAEALPRGTVATYGKGSAKLTAHRVTAIAVKPDAWLVMDDFLSSSDMVGWTALVPIEAEEEHKGLPVFPRPDDAPWPPHSTPNQDADGRWYYIDEDGYSTAHLGGHPFHDLMVAWIDSLPRTTRYVTPWEEA